MPVVAYVCELETRFYYVFLHRIEEAFLSFSSAATLVINNDRSLGNTS